MYGTMDKPVKSKKSVTFSKNNEVRYYDVEQQIYEKNNGVLDNTTQLLDKKNDFQHKKLNIKRFLKIGCMVIFIISLLLIFCLCL